MSEKYDHRMVGRQNLTELEAAVIALRREGWEIVNPEHGPTLAEALAVTTAGPHGMRLSLGVSMRRAKKPPG